MYQYWHRSAQFQLFLRVPFLLSQSSEYWTEFNRAFTRVMPDQRLKFVHYLWQNVKNMSALNSTKYLLYVIASSRVVLILIWNWPRNVNKWEAVLLERKQRLCCSQTHWHWAWQQNAKLRDLKWNKISSKNNQLYILYFNITFYHYSVAAHIPSILCSDFCIFRSFYRNKWTYGIAESHHILKRFQPYLLVSSGELLIFFHFTAWQ